MSFEKTIVDNIDSAFNSNKSAEKETFLSIKIPKWVKKLQKIITNTEEQSTSQSKSDIKELVIDLNKKIIKELQILFKEFRGELEQKIITKQSNLFKKLKKAVNLLIKEFEETLKKSLHIEYEIIEVNIDFIDFDQELAKSKELINKFIKSKTRTESIEVPYKNGIKVLGAKTAIIQLITEPKKTI